MSYCAIYSIRKKEEPIPKMLINEICFSTFYNSMFRYDVLDIFALRDYSLSDFSNYNSLSYTNEEIDEYVYWLKKCGFNLFYEVTKITVMTMDGDKQNDIEAIKFTINIKENSPIANLIIVNAVRYLYEFNYNYTEIPANFVRICKDEGRGDFHPMNVFLMVHSANNNYRPGHCICVHHLSPFMIHSDEEIKTHIIENKAMVSGTSALKKMKSITDADFDVMAESIKTDKPALAIEKFKALELKYGRRGG